jgi:DNA transformation protein and related proteins
MARRSDFVDFVAEQMAFVDGLRVRSMFGGFGIYQDGCMFALIASDRLYFKADATTRAEFEAQGLGPFTYVARGKDVTLQYYEAPPDVFEQQEAMRAWVSLAVETALRARRRGTGIRSRNIGEGTEEC